MICFSFKIENERYTELKKYFDDGGNPDVLLFYKFINDPECVKLLLESGLNPNKPMETIFCNVSPLATCLVYGSIECMELLLKYGADPNRPLDGELHPLLYAAFHTPTSKFLETFELLMKYGADINIKSTLGNSCMDLLHLDTFFKYSGVLLKYNPPLKYHPRLKQVPSVLKYWCQRKWVIIRSAVKLLSLHQRAVITANHPNRLKQLGYFNVKE
jgi:ankyrin repeat protein